jgi:hypothetical protein
VGHSILAAVKASNKGEFSNLYRNNKHCVELEFGSFAVRRA